jgi:hypothetical protein
MKVIIDSNLFLDNYPIAEPHIDNLLVVLKKYSVWFEVFYKDTVISINIHEQKINLDEENMNIFLTILDYFWSFTLEFLPQGDGLDCCFLLYEK